MKADRVRYVVAYRDLAGYMEIAYYYARDREHAQAQFAEEYTGSVLEIYTG